MVTTAPMTSKELVLRTMRGENPGRTPLYGWLSANLREELNAAFGSLRNFEDLYRFDLAHIGHGPSHVSPEWKKFREEKERQGEEFTPADFLDFPLPPVDQPAAYAHVRDSLAHHHSRDRFCYMQTNGIFEPINDIFGIENHLLFMALYPDEMLEIYRRLTDWNIAVAQNLIDLGVDGIHISDDWGAQKSLLFSRQMYLDMIYPFHEKMIAAYRRSDVLVSLHSDGCITPILDCVASLGFDFIHPWQETANMPYSLYLEKYADKFGILGGVCVQSTLGFGDLPRLKSEIDRVFGLLKGKRWACCTTHFVQKHCTLDELIYAYDLLRERCDRTH